MEYTNLAEAKAGPGSGCASPPRTHADEIETP